MKKENFKLNIKNDGKGKEQSFECCLEIDDDSMATIFGYGSTELEAKENSIKELKKHIEASNDSYLSLYLDIKLEKSGAYSYLNRMEVIFEDAFKRYAFIRSFLEKKGYECTQEYHPMYSPRASYKKDNVEIIHGCLETDLLSIRISNVSILYIEEYDFSNIDATEKLFKGFLHNPEIKVVEV